MFEIRIVEKRLIELFILAPPRITRFEKKRIATDSGAFVTTSTFISSDELVVNDADASFRDINTAGGTTVK